MQDHKKKPAVAICWHHQLKANAEHPSEYIQRIREISWYWTRQLIWQSSIEKVFEAEELSELWQMARHSQADYLLLVQDGQLIRSGQFIQKCIGLLEQHNHAAIAHLIAHPAEYPELNFQCFFADLKRANCDVISKQLDEQNQLTPFVRSPDNIHDDYTPMFIAQDEFGPRSELKENERYEQLFLSSLLKCGGVSNFSHDLRQLKSHLYPENKSVLFWQCLQGQMVDSWDQLDPTQKFYLECHRMEQTRDKIFVFNTEVLKPPQTTSGPLDHLYSVAAGFRPYILLAANGFHERTRVSYFDYSHNSLALKEFLWRHWDGSDYFEGCHNYLEHHGLNPSVFHDVGDKAEWSRRFEQVLSFFGGKEQWRTFWSRYQDLEHEFLPTNLFESDQALMISIEKSLQTAAPDRVWVWWSNCFYTEVGVVHFGKAQLKLHFERFFKALRERSPEIFGDGGNHDQLTWVAKLKDMPFKLD